MAPFLLRPPKRTNSSKLKYLQDLFTPEQRLRQFMERFEDRGDKLSARHQNYLHRNIQANDDESEVSSIESISEAGTSHGQSAEINVNLAGVHLVIQQRVGLRLNIRSEISQDDDGASLILFEEEALSIKHTALNTDSISTSSHSLHSDFFNPDIPLQDSTDQSPITFQKVRRRDHSI